MEIVRSCGDGVVWLEPRSEYGSPSDRVRCGRPDGREASAAAVAAAASSTVPV